MMVSFSRALGLALLLDQYSHRLRHSPHRSGVAAQFRCYLRCANALPGELDQSLDLAVGPLLWLLCFHGTALNLPPCLPVSLVADTWEIYGWAAPRAVPGFVQPLATGATVN